MGWRDGQFLSSRWNHYCELMMLYLLAIGSPTHPIAAASWYAFAVRASVRRLDYIGADDPLFVRQYSHAWFDFPESARPILVLSANSVTATRAPGRSVCRSASRVHRRLLGMRF